MGAVLGLAMVGCNPTSPAPEAPAPPAKPAMPPAAAPAALAPVPALIAKASVTPPATPPATQPAKALHGTVLQVSTESATRILAGTQTSTTRKGVRTLPVGPATLVYGTKQIPVEITHLTRVKFGDLSDADARSGGMSSADELKASLMKYNPNLLDSDDMTVIHFRLKQ